MNRMLSAAYLAIGLLAPWAMSASSANYDHSPSKKGQTATALVPGEMSQAGQLPAGYSASASYRCREGYDLYFTGNYIYWNWTQNSLKKGVVTSSASASSFILDPGYASGFQVGFGYSMPYADDWNLYANYTWYQNSASENLSLAAGQTFSLANDVEVDNLNLFSGNFSAEEKIKFNELELILERPFYFGKWLTANFGAGLDALFVGENYNGSYSGIINTLLVPIPYHGSDTLSIHTKAWSLGPKFVFNTNWLLGSGFAILANAATSALYTSFTTLNAEKTTSTITSPKVNTITPVLQMFLGLGWNGGFCNDNYRLGIWAGYDFDIYYNYDMLNFISMRSNDMNDDITLYGLNVQARFDF
ncbi:MAG: hypothetical protein KGI80_05250 [Verrucomicrobiota bacterium]|nr:hypothetical protein [Verrucomicrobiota bacterium]